MKKLLISFIITLTGFVATAQDQVDMKWKLNPGDTLIYLTVMEQIDSSYVDTDFGRLFNSISDSLSEQESKDLQKRLKEINRSIGNTQFGVRLFKSSGDHIQIEMFTVEEEQPIDNSDTVKENNPQELQDPIQNLMTGTVLRGSINENGTIHSFWVKRKQKNVVSLFFELPGRTVEVGDKWSLNTNLIGNDQNFVCDSSYYRNEVELIAIKEVNGDRVAVLKYDLREYVNGIFNVPSTFGTGGPEPTVMSFGFQGIAEFSIKKGRWISYDGVMFGDATGIMNAKQRVKYSLIEQ